MASQFNFRCTQQTQAGSNLVINIDEESKPTQLQVGCVSGEIRIEGESGDILGVPVAPIILTDGQAMNFNEASYKEITITIIDGTEYTLIANQ
jgi:hypothetical protein